MRIGDFLNLLHNVKPAGKNQWQADCPCGTHKTPEKHLSISTTDDKILVKCFGSDTTEDIVSAIGLQVSDLFLDTIKPITPVVAPKIVATYDYKDEKGELLYQVVRYQPKSFRQRKPDGKGGWDWNLNGTRRVLYHLESLQESYPGDTIYITEGEKDADNMWQWGYVATTSAGGAGNWQDNYAESLKDFNVVIVPDRDAAGYKYARHVAASLEGKVKSLATVLLPAKDFSEWLEQGGDATRIPDMLQDTSCLSERVDYKRFGNLVIWTSDNFSFKAEKVREERTGIHAKITIGQKGDTLAWGYLNIERGEDRIRLANQAKKNDSDLQDELNRFCEGLWVYYLDSETPEMVQGDPTVAELEFYLKPFIAKETGVILFAPPGKGKSFTAMLWAVSIDAGISRLWETEKATALYINLERSKISMSRRLSMINTALGLNPERPLLMMNARGKSLNDIYAACLKAVKDYNVKIIFLDSISRAGFGDLNENNPVNRIIDGLSGLCPTWVALAHTPRSDTGHVFGSIHFDAGSDVVVMLKSQEKEGQLGVTYEVTKSNDIPKPEPEVFALGFDGVKLVSAEKSTLIDFPDLFGESKLDMKDTVINYLMNCGSGKSTATQISKDCGLDRAHVSELLNKSRDFIKLPKMGKEQFYGLRE